MATLCLCPHMALFCVTESLGFFVCPNFLLLQHCQLDWFGPSTMTSFNLNYFFQGAVSQEGGILRYWSSRHQHVNLSRAQFTCSQGFCGCELWRISSWNHTGCREIPKFSDQCSYQKRKGQWETQRRKDMKASRDWCCGTTNPGMPRATTAGIGKKDFFPIKYSERVWLY